MFIRLCGLGEMSDHSADSEALRRVSNWLQIVISFFPCLFFFPLFSSHSDMPLSVLKHFFSCQDSGVKRSHFWSFAVTRGSWILLMLSGLIRKTTQTSASALCLPVAATTPKHGDRRKWHLCLLSLATNSRDAKGVLNFSHVYFLQNLHSALK